MPTILALRHVPHESLGLLERVFAERGLAYRYVDVWDAGLPALDAPDVAGVVVLGGPMNVDQVEEYPFLKDEPAWMLRAIEQGLPLLCICLGSQLLAKALGARVYPAAQKEIGWYEVELLPPAADDPLLAGHAARQLVFQWHGDTFEPPPGAVHLAQGSSVAQQAFRYGQQAWGLQFHAEVSEAMIEDWLAEPVGRCEIDALDYIDPEAIRRETPKGLARMHPFARSVFERFAGVCRRGSSGGLRPPLA